MFIVAFCYVQQTVKYMLQVLTYQILVEFIRMSTQGVS